MGCTVQKGSQRTRQSKANSSSYLICSTEAKIQIFIQTLSQTQNRDRSKSERSSSPSQTNNSSKFIKKSANHGERQNSQEIVIDLKQTNLIEVDQMSISMTPQFGKKNIKTISNNLRQISWQSVDHVMESNQSIQYYNRATKHRINHQDEHPCFSDENRQQGS